MSPSIRSIIWRRISLGLGLALTAWCLLALGARAQSADGCPGGANCIDASDFSADKNGWAANDRGVVTSWDATATRGLNDTANGVLVVSGTGGSNGGLTVRKDIYLDPGNYRLIARVSRDWSLGGLNSSLLLVVSAGGFDHGINIDGDVPIFSFGILTSDIIPITSSGPTGIELTGFGKVFYDYIWLEKMEDIAPTPTMNTNFPTLTPHPGTSIPPIAQATPQPTATPFCVDAPVVTAVSTYQPGPTPTPSASKWAFLDTFENLILGSAWSANGNDVYGSGNANHLGSGSHAAYIGYNGFLQSVSATSAFSEALILPMNFTVPIYLNAWAQADVIPIGATGLIEIWEHDPDSSTWHRSGQFNISARNWYPFHAEVSPVSGASIDAIAFVSTRSDEPEHGSGGIYLDDVYVYGDPSLTPHCDGTYPEGVVDLNAPGAHVAEIPWWPADRPCPTLPPEPNNFWGPLLTGLQIFMNGVFAWSPLHPTGQLTSFVSNFLLSPIGVLFTFSAILFDWTTPLWVLKIWLGWNGIYYAILAWRIIRYSTVQ